MNVVVNNTCGFLDEKIFPYRDGERLRRVKLRKLMGWDTESLTSKAKVVHASKAMQGIHPPLALGREVFSYSKERASTRALSHIVVTWQNKSHHFKTCPFPSFSGITWLNMMPYDIECPFGDFGSAVPAVTLPTFMCTPSLLTCGLRSRKWYWAVLTQQ